MKALLKTINLWHRKIQERYCQLVAPKIYNELIELQKTLQAKSGVYGVDINWKTKYHQTDLSNVMQAEDCRFIGTNEKCKAFVNKHSLK